MKGAVIGASGKTGIGLVRQSLEYGFDIAPDPQCVFPEIVLSLIRFIKNNAVIATLLINLNGCLLHPG